MVNILNLRRFIFDINKDNFMIKITILGFKISFHIKYLSEEYKEMYKNLIYFNKSFKIPEKIINRFKKRQNSNKIFKYQYKKDVKDYNEIINNINPSELKPAKGIFRQYQLDMLDFAKEILSDLNYNLTELNNLTVQDTLGWLRLSIDKTKYFDAENDAIEDIITTHTI